MGKIPTGTTCLDFRWQHERKGRGFRHRWSLSRAGLASLRDGLLEVPAVSPQYQAVAFPPIRAILAASQQQSVFRHLFGRVSGHFLSLAGCQAAGDCLFNLDLPVLPQRAYGTDSVPTRKELDPCLAPDFCRELLLCHPGTGWGDCGLTRRDRLPLGGFLGPRPICCRRASQRGSLLSPY